MSQDRNPLIGILAQLVYVSKMSGFGFKPIENYITSVGEDRCVKIVSDWAVGQYAKFRKEYLRILRQSVARTFKQSISGSVVNMCVWGQNA
jgi:hypothetical protein